MFPENRPGDIRASATSTPTTSGTTLFVYGVNWACPNDTLLSYMTFCRFKPKLARIVAFPRVNIKTCIVLGLAVRPFFSIWNGDWRLHHPEGLWICHHGWGQWCAGCLGQAQRILVIKDINMLIRILKTFCFACSFNGQRISVKYAKKTPWQR